MQINKVAVLTSGGDAPGMNAAIRAVVRASLYYSLEVYGCYGGYNGLIEGAIQNFNLRSVSNILGNGGTMLKSSRSETFRTKEGRQKAYDHLKAHEIDALIAIGGDGTLAGAHALYQDFGMPVLGIPATIDNDIFGTDQTIGFDTACNIAMECIDKIRDTANSHNRLFFVEVMGKQSGFIALQSGIATGAICIMMPEKKISVDELISIVRRGYRNNKSSSIVIVAEGNANGGAFDMADQLKASYKDYEVKVTVLGHLQRGGDPSCQDRVLASELGVGAVEGLLNGQSDVMVGVQNGKIVYTPIVECIANHPEPKPNQIKIAQILSI